MAIIAPQYRNVLAAPVVLTVDVVKIVIFSCISDLVVGLVVVDVGGWKVVLILLITCDDYIAASTHPTLTAVFLGFVSGKGLRFTGLFWMLTFLSPESLMIVRKWCWTCCPTGKVWVHVLLFRKLNKE